MNFFDSLAHAARSVVSEENRLQIRDEALALARNGDWLSRAIQHHRKIEALFNAALHEVSGQQRLASLHQLEHLLSAHAMAEEVVLYPAMVLGGQRADATVAYEEEAETKIDLARLDRLDPYSDEWRDKLEDIRGFVIHHLYEEEADWFPRLHDSLSEEEAAALSVRFGEEFERHGDANRISRLASPTGVMPS